MPPGVRLSRAVATPGAQQLTHVAVGDFCRAQAVRDALGAAGGAVPCEDEDRQRVGTAHGQGAEGQGTGCGTHRRSRNRSCRRGRGSGRSRGCCGSDLRDRRVPVTLGGTLAPGLHGCWAQGSSHHPCPGTGRAQSQGQSWHRARDRAGTYPGETLGVPGKAREERDRPGEMQSPRTALPAPQQRSLGPPCPLTLGFIPRDSRGRWGTPAEAEALPQAQRAE